MVVAYGSCLLGHGEYAPYTFLLSLLHPPCPCPVASSYATHSSSATSNVDQWVFHSLKQNIFWFFCYCSISLIRRTVKSAGPITPPRGFYHLFIAHDTHLGYFRTVLCPSLLLHSACRKLIISFEVVIGQILLEVAHVSLINWEYQLQVRDTYLVFFG